MSFRVIARTTLAACLFSAMPLASANALTAAQVKAQQTATAAAAQAAQATQATQAQHLANLKTKGAAEIDRRIASLAAASEKLAASTKLAAADKTALLKTVTDENTGLSALKDHLASDTTLETARADVASIVLDYRVYALLLPKVRMVSTVDRLEVVEAKLTDITAKLETNLAAAQVDAKTRTDLEASLAKIKSSLAAAKEKTGPLGDKILALTPTDYNADHAAVLGYRATLASARDDIRTASSEAKALNLTLKKL
jgi:hypothetical protein